MEPETPLQEAVTSSPEKQPSMTHNRIFKNLVSTSQKTTRLLYREKPFGKKKVVHNKNSTKPVSTLSGQFAKVLKLMRILRIVESSGVPRGVGGFTPPPPPKFRRYRWSPRSHEQEEPASRFPFAVHCVLIRL